MTNKEFRKLFKEEFNKQASCDISLSEILPEETNLNNNLFQSLISQKKKTKFF